MITAPTPPGVMGAVKGVMGFWDEILAVGLGGVIIDYLGDTVGAWLGKYVPAAWVDVVTEGAIGFAVYVLGELVVPVQFRIYTRLAGFGALGIAVAHAIKQLMGGGATEGGESSVEPSSTYWPYV